MAGTCKYQNRNSKAEEAVSHEKTRNLSSEEINKFITHVFFKQQQQKTFDKTLYLINTHTIFSSLCK